MQNKINKRAMSEVIVIILVIALTLVSAGIAYTVIMKQVYLSPELINCNQLRIDSPIKITQACYLNNDEIKVQVERNFKEITFTKLLFSFSGTNEAIFEVYEKKCSDVKNEENYGEKCKLIGSGESLSYTFNITNENFNQVSVGISNGETCYLYAKEITSCN